VLDDLERAQRAVDVVRVDAGAELDARAMTMSRFGHTAPVFLADRYGWPKGRAKACLRTGRKLRQLPLVREALRQGRINLDQAAVICRAANPRVFDVVAGSQDELVALAHGVRFERFSRDVRALVDLADEDGGHDPTPEHSRLRLQDGSAGELLLDGVLVGADAAAAREALRHWADVMFRRHKDEQSAIGDVLSLHRDHHAADALVELLRRGHAADTSTTRAPVADITLVIHRDQPGPRIWGSPSRCVDVSGLRYPSGTIDLLTCDPVVHTLVVDAHGVPLELGSAVRFANRDQRRAVAVRDGGCVFPGCDAPPGWTDLHHVVRVADGGSTDLHNLASLCRRHHGVVHSRGWSMRTVDDQWFDFTAPSGIRLASQRHGRPRAGPSG
jgi:hypothetical protein